VSITPSQTHDRTPRLSWTSALDPEDGPIIYSITVWNGTNDLYPILIESNMTTDTFFDIVEPLVYHQTYYIEIVASDQYNATSRTINGTLEVVNHLPSSPTLKVSDKSTSDEDIVCKIEDVSSDEDTDPTDVITYNYKWYLNGQPIPSLSVNQSQVLETTVPASMTGVGDNWTCTVTPSDGFDNGVAVNSSVIIINTAPSHILPFPVVSLEEDIPLLYSIDLDDHFSDIDGDMILYDIREQIVGLEITIFPNGSVTFTPEPDWAGVATVSIWATDGIDSIFANLTIQVAAVNDPPVIEPVGTITVKEGSWYRSIPFHASDVDGDTLEYSTDIGIHLWALSEGENYTIDGASGEVELLCDNSMVGTHSLNLTVSDGNGSTVFQSFSLVVENTNNPPSVRIGGVINNSRISIIETVDLMGLVDDPDLHIPDSKEILSYAWIIDGLYIIGYDKDVIGFKFPAGGVHQVELRVSDNEVSASDSVTLSVDDVRGVLLRSPVNEITVPLGGSHQISLNMSNVGTGPDLLTPSLDAGALFGKISLSQDGIATSIESSGTLTLLLNISIPEGDEKGDFTISITVLSSDGTTQDSIDLVIHVVEPKGGEDGFLDKEGSVFILAVILLVCILIIGSVFAFWNRRIRKQALDDEAKKLSEASATTNETMVATIPQPTATSHSSAPTQPALPIPTIPTPVPTTTKPEPEVRAEVQKEMKAPVEKPRRKLDRDRKMKKKMSRFLEDVTSEDFDLSTVTYATEKVEDEALLEENEIMAEGMEDEEVLLDTEGSEEEEGNEEETFEEEDGDEDGEEDEENGLDDLFSV